MNPHHYRLLYMHNIGAGGCYLYRPSAAAVFISAGRHLAASFQVRNKYLSHQSHFNSSSHPRSLARLLDTGRNFCGCSSLSSIKKLRNETSEKKEKDHHRRDDRTFRRGMSICGMNGIIRIYRKKGTRRNPLPLLPGIIC